MLPHRKIVADPRITSDSQSPQATQHPTATHALPTGANTASVGSPALSPTIEWLIVALALLLAIIVALWARSLSASLSSLSVGAGVEWSGDGTLASPAAGIAETMVDDAPMTPTRGVTTSGLTTPPFPRQVSGRESPDPATSPLVLRLPARPRAVPHTASLLGFAESAVAPDTSAVQPLTGLAGLQGNGRFRRTILLPSQPGTPNGEMAEVDAHPSGLLTRYGKTQQE